MADYSIITGPTPSTLNIRTIYDNAIQGFSDGQNAILQYSDVKMEFFVGTARTSYLPYRTNTSYYFPWWGADSGNIAEGFVAYISGATYPQFPCIGRKIANAITDEGNVADGWLAFHPASTSNGDSTKKLSIKITPQNNKTITGYKLYYQDQYVESGSIGIATGQNATEHQYARLYGANTTPPANWSYDGSFNGYAKVFSYTKTLATSVTSNDFLYINIDDAQDNLAADGGTIKMELYTYVTPTPLTFVNNTLTVANDISATDLDLVSFQLPAGSIMYSFNVTSLLNANSITYTLGISGGAIVSTGTITSTGVTLLGGNNLTPGVDTTYILTLTSGSTNTYTIIGKMLGPGYTTIPYAPPIIHHDFNPAGTNKGSLGSIYNITSNPTIITDPIHVQKGMGAHYSGETGMLPSCIMDNGGTFTTSANGFFVSLWFKHNYDMTTTRYYSKKTKQQLLDAGYGAPSLLTSTTNTAYVRGIINSLFFSLSNIPSVDPTGSILFGYNDVNPGNNNKSNPLIWSSYNGNSNGVYSIQSANIGISDNATTTPATIGVFNGETDFHHLVIDYGSTDDTVKVYVDNVLMTSYLNTSYQFRNFTHGKITLQSAMLDTYLNDFRIYNYAATIDFISYLYKLGSNTNIVSLSNISIDNLIAAGASLSQLVNIGKPINDIINAGYTIDELINANVSASQLLAAGVPFSQLVNYAQWLDLSATSNIFNRTYVNNFIDLSGSLLIRNNGALTVGGDTSFNYVTLNGTKYVANDLVVTSNLFIGNDISINGNLSVGGDVSINNQFSGNFANNLIPTTAIENYPSGGSNVAISGNVRIAGDVSFNGTTVDLSTNTVLQVDDYITFNDGSIMARHDDLKSRMFDMSASSVITTDVSGVSQGQRILCSSDGKYVAINMGGATYQAGNYTQSSTGIDISQDYGATFTRKYLNNPTDGTTPLYRPYPCLSISLTGQFMICCSYGATGHNVSDNVIGFSNNYGATWSTAYLKDLIGTGTEVMYIRGVAISSDGATMIIDVFRSDNMHMYKTTSKSLSGFTLISNRGSAYFAENTLKLIQAGGVEYIVAQSLDNQDKGRLVIYYLSSGTNLHTSTINYGGNTDISIPFNAINCIITGPAGQISRVDCREDFVYNQPNITDISNNYSPATTRMSSVQSPLGKHILIGPFINSSYNSPNITDATRLRYSTNGGYTFKTVSGLVSNTFTAIKSVALSDRGHMYIVDDIGSGNLKYVAAKFELMRDVTFKSVVVNGQATVAGTITQTSDYRIKENVSNLNNNDTIDDLVPIQYNNILSGKHEFGLFAHELQSIYPELVEGEKDGAEYQRVDYNGLIGVLVKEVQDLKKRVAVIKK